MLGGREVAGGTRPQADAAQFLLRPLDPELRAELLEALPRILERRLRLALLPLTPQDPALDQASAGRFERRAEPLELRRTKTPPSLPA
ncbi:MAG TPA: hypothetical protein VJ744_06200 [Gaiellaceae bacterium]|nr:hypothetical protein [Gaiellaceae bacterium]